MALLAPRRPVAARTLATALEDPEHPLRAALDSMNANCFIADTDLDVVYMNHKAAATMATLAPVVKRTFGLDLDDLLHGSIHRFHKDPARIERILTDPSALPRDAEFTFGGISLRTLINAVRSPAGELHGYIVVWDDVTARAQEYREIRDLMTGVTGRAGQIVEQTARGAEGAQSLAGATEQLRASVGEIARSTETATGQITDVVAAVHEAVLTMDRLQQAGQEIGAFLRLITGVADQTKLLALNATIEAARAGEMGKGFAVVADEVKNLAGTTAESTSDIEARINAIQEIAATAAHALMRIEELVGGISESQTSIASAIEEQSAVTADIARSTSQVNDECHLVAGEAEEITAEMAQVVERADRLQQGG